MFRTIISLVGLVAAGSIFFLFTKPSYDTVQQKRTEIVQYDAALQKANELQARKQELLSRYNAFNQTDRERLEKLLPDHVDNVRLILDLDNMASRHGMAIQNVVTSGTTAQDASQSASSVIGASKQKYDSLTVTFTTQGTYETFRTFLADLERSLRIVDLVTLKIADASAQRAGEPIYTFNITLRTYWLK